MEVILLERVERLGIIGDVVRVKPGFARNFLLPQKKALRATKENLAYFETQKAQIEANNVEHRKEAEKIAGKLTDTVLVVIRQAGESGQLYGSVTAKDIADGLGGQKIAVNRQQVRIDHPIKMLGVHPVRVDLHPEVTIKILVNVAKSEDEAATQLEEVKSPAPAKEEVSVVKEKSEETEASLTEEEIS